MNVFLLTLVLAVVMVAQSSETPAKVTLPPELPDKIKSKGVEIFQEYLKWKDAQPAGRGRFRISFREWLKKQKEQTPPIAEAKDDEEEETASQNAKDENSEDEQSSNDSETYTTRADATTTTDVSTITNLSPATTTTDTVTTAVSTITTTTTTTTSVDGEASKNSVIVMVNDQWTRSISGCTCYFDKTSTKCACCRAGGCQCPRSNLHQCVKCGQGEMCGRLVVNDQWTRSISGCTCYFDKSSTKCACCHAGGCQCPRSNLHQCVKCGHGEMCGRHFR